MDQSSCVQFQLPIVDLRAGVRRSTTDDADNKRPPVASGALVGNRRSTVDFDRM